MCGIEMGGHNPDSGIPILLGSEVNKDDIPVGTLLSVDFTPSATIVIHAEKTSAPVELEAIFPTSEDGRLVFGWSAHSRRRGTTTADLQTRDVEFVDYVMEGFVTYHINAAVSGNTRRLFARLLDV